MGRCFVPLGDGLSPELQQLCKQASEEQNTDKLVALVQRINELLKREPKYEGIPPERKIG